MINIDKIYDLEKELRNYIGFGWTNVGIKLHVTILTELKSQIEEEMKELHAES